MLPKPIHSQDLAKIWQKLRSIVGQIPLQTQENIVKLPDNFQHIIVFDHVLK